jgi:hypothetical protein
MSQAVSVSNAKASRMVSQKPVTTAGKSFNDNLTIWLQETRLMSESAFRLVRNYQKDGNIQFEKESWPKKSDSKERLDDFKIKSTQLSPRMEVLLKHLWSNRFIFLETLWEAYLQELVKELRHKDTTIFEPFCERDFMAEVVRNVLIDQIASVEEIKDEVAARFAAGITRQSWIEQWKQLAKLKIGLSDQEKKLPWFNELDVYFEMRNCIIHRQGRVSPRLQEKSSYFKDKGISTIDIWPTHLDHYRHQFIKCMLLIEAKISAKFNYGE